MASGIKNTTGNRFKITFEAPWGGVASNKNPLDIQDNQFVTCDGLVDIDGVLAFVQSIAATKYFRFIPATTGAVPYLIFVLNEITYAVDQLGNLYIQDSAGGPPATYAFRFRAAASDGPWNDIPNAAQVINGLIYISVYTRNSIYVFDPVANTLTLASNYTGGMILGVLDDYLLQMNTNSAVDGQQPTRVNWSGPGEFSTWDPSVNRAAGFNTLINIDDSITGFISLASVGIIIGQKGLVQASPTGIGIEPFAFNTLWTSDVGQGVLYPFTVSQYGQNTYAGTNSGIFKISTSGYQDVSGAARKAILAPLQVNVSNPNPNSALTTVFAGSIFLFAFNATYPTPYYVFAGVTPSILGVSRSTLVIWFLNLETGAWFQQTLDVDTVLNAYTGGTDTFSIVRQLRMVNVTPAAPSGEDNKLPTVLIYAAVDTTTGSGVVTKEFILSTYVYSDINNGLSEYTAGPINVVTRAYELEPWSEPTIRRIIVKAFGSGTLALSINGVSFGNIVLDGTTTTKRYISTGGVYTGLSPQLTVTSSNFQGCIVKIIMYGTLADGEPD